jgi:hypothetical protein
MSFVEIIVMSVVLLASTASFVLHVLSKMVSLDDDGDDECFDTVEEEKL